MVIAFYLIRMPKIVRSPITGLPRDAKLIGSVATTRRSSRSSHEVTNVERRVNFFHRSRFLVKTSADLIIRFVR